MLPRKPIHLLLLCTLILLAAGCAGLNTVVPAADTPLPTGESSSTAVPAPTEMPAPTSTPAEDPQPVDDPESLKLRGFAVQMTCTKAQPCTEGSRSDPDGARLMVFAPDGELAGVEALPRPGQVFHVWGAGSPLSYFFADFESGKIQQLVGDTVEREYTLPGGHFYMGVPGIARFAATILPGITDTGRSEIQMVPGLGYVAVAPVPQKLVLPVQVQQQDEFNLDLWYTEEPYGIGGDIVFPIWNGLRRLDGENTIEVLPPDLNFSAVSSDGQQVAFTEIPSGPMGARALQSGKETEFALLPGQDRGAGYAVFSPDGTHLAWVEASGSLAYENFSNTLRIASLDEGQVLNWSSEQVTAWAGGAAVSFRPVAWLDDHTILVQINPAAKVENAHVVILDLLDSSAPQVVDGFFVSLVWGY